MLLSSLQTLAMCCSFYLAPKLHSVVFLLHSACLCVFTYLVLWDVDCTLLWPLRLHFLELSSLLFWHWHALAALGLPWYLNNKTTSATAALEMNCNRCLLSSPWRIVCILKCDRYLHSEVWWIFAFLNVMNVCIPKCVNQLVGVWVKQSCAKIHVLSCCK